MPCHTHLQLFADVVQQAAGFDNIKLFGGKVVFDFDFYSISHGNCFAAGGDGGGFNCQFTTFRQFVVIALFREYKG